MFPTYLTVLEYQWKLIVPRNVSNMFDSADFSIGSLHISGNLSCQDPICLTSLEYQWKLIMPGHDMFPTCLTAPTSVLAPCVSVLDRTSWKNVENEFLEGVAGRTRCQLGRLA